MRNGNNRGARCRFGQRRLVVEGLETRWMLAGDTGAVLAAADAADAATVADADWPGFLVSDLNGNLMFADVEGTLHADLLATTSFPLYDIAISPSGRVLGVGGPIDGSSILYDLNVDFDNPGGLINPVAIDWIGAGGNGVRMNGLEFTADGALLGTGYGYPGFPSGNYLYSLDENTAAATQLVNLGGYESAGDVTADEDGVVYCISLDGSLLRISEDYSGYSVVGNVGYNDVYGMTYGPGPELRGYRSNGNVLNIDPTDASWVGEGAIWTSTVPSTSLLLGAATIFDPPTDLGEVDFVELTGQSAIREELWYRFDTMHDGYVTVELDDLSTTSGLELRLHREDADGDLEEIASGTTRVDYETAVAGERYFVEITGLGSEATVRVGNQVEAGADTLTIHGTSQSDDLELAIGSPYLVDINGIDYELSFGGAVFVTTTFDGDSGGDLIRVLGGDGDDAADIDMATRSGQVAGPDFEVHFTSTAVMEFDGRDGYDTANIQGTDVDSELHLAPFQGELVEGTVRGTVLHAEEIGIDAAGGQDHVIFDGGTKADRLDLNPTSGLYREYVPVGELRDPTYSISADHVESNYASSGGGIDAVFLRDSDGDETFMAGLGLVNYEGPGFAHEIHGFRVVHAYGLNGGFDQATIYDTPYDDKFKGKEDFGNLRGGGFYFRAKAFESIESTALYGGDDLAVLYDTSGDDLFTASYETATMAGSGLTRTASGFNHVLARATGGYDIARLEDSPGRDEFRGRSHKSTFLSLDDDALDVTVRAFDEVHAQAVHGGIDIGKMHDTAGDNHLTGTGDNAQMYINSAGSLDLLYEVIAFENVKAYWSTGTDTKDIVPPTDFTYYEEFL